VRLIRLHATSADGTTQCLNFEAPARPAIVPSRPLRNSYAIGRDCIIEYCRYYQSDVSLVRRFAEM